MSRTKHVAYATYSKYNKDENGVSASVTTTGQVDNGRFSNAPPPLPNTVAEPPQPPQQLPPSHQPHQPHHQPPVPEDDPSAPNRVNHMEPDKLYNLLTNPQYRTVKQGDQPTPLRILIKVYTDWCKPCKLVAPEIKKLSLDPRYASLLFVEVDGDQLNQHEKLASILRCSSVPTFFTFSGGKQTGFMTGIKMDEIIALCDNALLK
jgi:thiol-disulfide isomerase/thioredoxin